MAVWFNVFTLFSDIRHPEELSLTKPLEPHHLKNNLKNLKEKKRNGELTTNGHAHDTNTFIRNGSVNGSQGSLDKQSPGYLCAPVTPHKSLNSTPIGSPLVVGFFLSEDFLWKSCRPLTCFYI